MTDERYAPESMPPGAVQRRLPASLREHGPFRLLFWGQALSVMGDRITPVAIAFAVLGLGSATDLGIVLAAGGIPFALFALAGGVWADRVGRRKVMLASDVVRAVSQTATAALLLTGTAEVWMLAVLAFVYGTAAALFMPALIGLIPQTVSPGRLQEANGLMALTRSVASVAGPAVAGVLVVAAGSGEAIAVDAATFAVSALCLARMRPGGRIRARRRGRAFLAGLRGGWNEVRSRAWLRWGLIAMSIYHVFVLPAVFVLGPALSERQLDGASSWAAIVACFGSAASWATCWRCASRCGARCSSPPWRWSVPARRPRSSAAASAPSASPRWSCWPASASRSSSPSGTSASRSRSPATSSRA